MADRATSPFFDRLSKILLSNIHNKGQKIQISEALLVIQAPMLLSVASIMGCLKLQRMAKRRIRGWDGDFSTLPQPQQMIIWILSYMQTFPTVSMWLLCSALGIRRYMDMIPLPPSFQSKDNIHRPALYIGKPDVKF
jgi:hypothetical protein